VFLKTLVGLGVLAPVCRSFQNWQFLTQSAKLLPEIETNVLFNSCIENPLASCMYNYIQLGLAGIVYTKFVAFRRLVSAAVAGDCEVHVLEFHYALMVSKCAWQHCWKDNKSTF